MVSMSPERGGALESSLLDDAEDVLLAHDQVFLAADLDLGSGVGREQDAVALLDRELGALAVVQHAAVADGDDLAFLGLLLGGVGQEDAAGGLLFGLDALQQDAVAEGTDGQVLGLGGHGS